MSIQLVNVELKDEPLTDLRARIVTFKGDTAYVAGQGGTAGIAGILGFSPENLLALVPLSHAGVSWDYDPGTDKLKLYGQPAAAAAGASPELASGNYSALQFRALALGR